MLLSSFLKCSINFSKRCFSPQTWKHTFSSCMWNSKHKHSKIRCRKSSLKKLFPEYLSFSSLNTVYFSSKLVNSQKQQHEPGSKVDPWFLTCSLDIWKSASNVLFFHWLSLQSWQFSSLHQNPRMLLMVKRTKSKSTVFLCIKALLK